MKPEDKIIQFNSWDDVSNDFEGHCYCFRDKMECWVSKGRIIHRDEGPAQIFEHYNRRQMWWNKGMYHRIGGPAITESTRYLSGEKIKQAFYINGREYYTEQNYWKHCFHNYWAHPSIIQIKLEQVLKL